MFQNKYEQSQSNQTSSLDIDNMNKTHIPKTLNIVEQTCLQITRTIKVIVT